MSIDVVDLRNFYGQRLGVVARRFIGRGIRSLWGDTAGQRVLGIGYATPYLGLFREEAERCLAFMPAGQGVVKWPTTRPALSALVYEGDLPLADSAVDRVMLVHALEMTNDPGALLREVWRVLASGGRLLAVVPNRRGVWARTDTTPFGHGRPYSLQPAGVKRFTCRRSRAAGSCGPRLRGSARAQRSQRRSPVCIWWRRPSRSIARYPHAAKNGYWYRRWNRCSRHHPAGDADYSGCRGSSLALLSSGIGWGVTFC
jgi:SAM-dependent methyltransferase